MNNTFGDFLYTLRKEKGITQYELAEQLGITNKAVSKWETGEAMPETSLLVPISRIFGVSVDELLNGKRATAADADKTANITVKIDKFDADKHLFTRGKNDAPKTRRELICGVLCATTILIGVIVYIIIGTLFELWDPYWVIIPTSALFCGIIGIIFDVTNRSKRLRKLARCDNPYTDAVCGILMISCIIVYLFIGAVLFLWHPYWLIVVIGALSCGVIGALGKVFVYKTAADKTDEDRTYKSE